LFSSGYAFILPIAQANVIGASNKFFAWQRSEFRRIELSSKQDYQN
jgi:hypothetical protein